MLTGENGILTQAQNARDETRSGAVEEAKDLWKNTQALDKGTGGDDAQSLDELLADLEEQGLLTKDEVAEVKRTGSVTIVEGKPIDFGLTIGSVYTDDMIGQNVTYSANGQSDWIIFGKDTNGNILLTTAKPIDNAYELYGGAENWLNYENDLNVACSGYGTTIQGKEVTSRSITMNDINYVSGFDVSKLNFDTYTFGTVQNYAGKQVNYYFPSLDAESNDYWQKPSSNNTASFDNNWYGYYYNMDTGELVYYYSGTGGDYPDATDFIKNSDKVQYIWGENSEDTAFDEYLVASRSVIVDSSFAQFFVAGVGRSGVSANDYYLCDGYASTGYDYEERGSFGIRPIVVLPSDIEVEQNESGLYDIAYY